MGEAGRGGREVGEVGRGGREMGEVGRGGREMGGKWEGDVRKVEGHSSEYMFIIHGLPFTLLFL